MPPLNPYDRYGAGAESKMRLTEGNQESVAAAYREKPMSEARIRGQEKSSMQYRPRLIHLDQRNSNDATQLHDPHHARVKCPHNQLRDQCRRIRSMMMMQRLI